MVQEALHLSHTVAPMSLAWRRWVACLDEDNMKLESRAVVNLYDGVGIVKFYLSRS